MPAPPLSDLLVADLSRHLPGPLAAKILSDLGARVVKVEAPEGGDPLRQAPPLEEGRSALARLLLSGVESLALDLKSPRARGVLEALLARADVLLETFRPGTLERLGLPPAELAERFPRLVLCSLSGWGREGPYAGRAGHDLTYQAVAGALAPTGGMPALPAADLLGAWSAAGAVLAALHRRERTGGRGGWIDAALHGNVVAWAEEAGGEKGVGEATSLTGALPCYNVYRTRDDHLLAVGALEPPFWRRLCQAAGRRDLLRLQHRADARSRRQVASMVRGRTLEAWRELLAAEDVPAEAVLSPAEALAHPQVRARGVVEEGGDGSLRLAFPARFDGQRPRGGASFPELGEDTLDLLRELGLPEAELPPRELRRAGIGPRRSLRGALLRLLSSRL